jgi:hypothetical protein
MHLPPAYALWLSQLAFHDVSFSYSGIELLAPEEIDDAQVGYSRSAEGKPGSWRPEWIVIGRETALGDPIILDNPSPDLRVMSAMHGEGAWKPVVIAASLAGFGDALRELKRASVGRETPAALEQNPLSSDQRELILPRMRAAIGPEADIEFWRAMVEE